MSLHERALRLTLWYLLAWAGLVAFGALAGWF